MKQDMPFRNKLNGANEVQKITIILEVAGGYNDAKRRNIFIYKK